MIAYVEFRHKSFHFLNNQNSGGYTCLVTSLVIDQQSDQITIVGEHKENESNRSVVGVSIRNQTQLQKFPGQFGKIFPNVKYFEIDNSSITMLRKEDFLYLGHLQGLWLPRNPIVSLPNDLFVNVQGLRFLSFFKNKLKFVGPDLLKPLLSLESANFQENTTIDKNFNGEEEKLAELNHEIGVKCIAPPKVMKLESNENAKFQELEARVKFLETKVKKVESEKQMLQAKILQLQGLSQIVEILQSRVDDLENVDSNRY